MFSYMKTVFLVERKNVKFRSIFYILILFIIGSIIYLENSHFRELKTTTAAEVVALRSALDQFRKVDATDPEVASPLYQNLLKQSSNLAFRTLGIMIKDDSTYVKGAIELSKIREEAYTIDGFNGVSKFIPTHRQNQLENALFTSIESQNEKLLVDNSNFPTYIILLLLVLGYGWYLLVGIFSSDILLDEEEHKSLVNSYPITLASKLTAKILSYFIFVIVLLIFTLILSVTVASLVYGIDLTYPVAIFNGGYFTIPIWQYIGLAFLYFICLSLIAISISIILSYYLKNLYIVTFTHFFFFFVMQLIPIAGKWLWFLPFNYFNFSTVINGQVAEITENQMITLNTGYFVLVITIIILFLFIYWQFYRSKSAHRNTTSIRAGEA